MGHKRRSGFRPWLRGSSDRAEDERVENTLGRRPQIIHTVVPCNPDDSHDPLPADRLDVLTVEYRGEADPALAASGAVRAVYLGRDEPPGPGQWVVFGERCGRAVAQPIAGTAAQLRDPVGVTESEQWTGISRQTAACRQLGALEQLVGT
ncbi:MAG TPA: hypothetical protein VIJ60_03805, partial [Acidimicrobiales bacterium]